MSPPTRKDDEVKSQAASAPSNSERLNFVGESASQAILELIALSLSPRLGFYPNTGVPGYIF
jgi:hypothetical protein